MQSGDKTAHYPTLHAVPGAFAAMLLDELRSVGGDPDAVLRSLGLAFTHAALAGGRVPLVAEADFVRLYGECITALSAQANRERDLAPMRKEEVDMLCYCVISCTTLAEVIARAARFCAMLGERAAVLSLERVGTDAVFHMKTVRLCDSASGLLTDLNGLSFYHRLFAWLIGERIPVARYGVFADERVERRLLEAFFGRDIAFGCDDNRFVFPAEFLDRPVVRSSERLEERLALFPFEQLRDPTYSGGVAQTIEQLIGAQLARAQPVPTLEQFASLLNLSPATLRRRLHADDQSLGAIKAHVRRRLAEELLAATPRHKVQEIAARLDFSDARAFRRAFQAWTGFTPERWRAQHASATITDSRAGAPRSAGHRSRQTPK